MNAVDEFTKQFTKETLPDVFQLRRNFFSVSEPLMKFKKTIPQEPFALGMFVGTGKPLHPSIALLDWLNERTDRYVVLDKKSAWLFVCGRDVFEEGIVQRKANDGLVLVRNELGEMIGLGKFSTRDKKIPLKNVLDRGDFLRRER